jgi:hypothetical protein
MHQEAHDSRQINQKHKALLQKPSLSLLQSVSMPRKWHFFGKPKFYFRGSKQQQNEEAKKLSAAAQSQPVPN